MPAQTIVEQLVELYTTKATRFYGLSDVTQLQHALQAAAFAEIDRAGAQAITAALLHDLGHMIHQLGDDPASSGVDDRHEILGAKWLARHFPPSVSEPVRLHVAAKRYLCATVKDYGAGLSDDSVRSLALQGGAMGAGEILAFEAEPYFREAVALRRYDDKAKDPARITPGLDYYVRFIEQSLAVPA
ncbi:MAG: HD domain-containing protein [Rhodospirillales bacterium]